ncbi:PAN/Apple domain-containing protein [Marinicella gelatinilytica]|uniref:hypothetical protein n=1 Tax=Marinicella gelatinilytica TaxID=2996017 RepID=UPI002260F401|nr:hypothetical protein [Marinicella gelatinilytica]MCX7543845.1 hypothetical protein [Marinicella gelatinilytica]
MINKKFVTATILMGLMGLSSGVQAMQKDTIYSMPADGDHNQFYLADDVQPEKGTVADAAQCSKACEAADVCVVWVFKPGRFGSPNSCKLSPKMMQEKGITTPFSGAASGVIE